jgi:hypothetical protein
MHRRQLRPNPLDQSRRQRRRQLRRGPHNPGTEGQAVIGTTWTEASACGSSSCVQVRWTGASACTGATNCVEVRLVRE